MTYYTMTDAAFEIISSDGGRYLVFGPTLYDPTTEPTFHNVIIYNDSTIPVIGQADLSEQCYLICRVAERLAHDGHAVDCRRYPGPWQEHFSAFGTLYVPPRIKS